MIVNKKIATLFRLTANAILYKGGNKYRAAAYKRAAKLIEEAPDVERLYRQGKLHELPLTKKMIDKIKEFIETGRIVKCIEELSGTPVNLLPLLDYPNITVEDIRNAEKMGISTPSEFLKNIRKILPEDRLRRFLEALEMYQGKMLLHEALSIAEDIMEYLMPYCERIAVAGSIRRMKELVRDIDILAVSGHDLIRKFCEHPDVEKVLMAGDVRASVIIRGKQVDLRLIPIESWGAALQYFTGSKAHNIKLRQITKSMGYKLSEYGLFRGSEMIAGSDEEDIYQALGMQWIPPELREDKGEIEAAREGRLPKLVEYWQVKGDLHCHTTYSDGKMTPEQLVKEAIRRGYSYIAITDHSYMMKPEGLRRQLAEIEQLRTKYPEIRILTGTELECNSEGHYDFPKELLEKLDIVIASIHVATDKDLTEAYIRLCNDPHVKIIGHMTGRLLLKRPPRKMDVERVLREAAKTGKLIEINGQPERMDLPPEWVRIGKRLGCKFTLGTDAHSSYEMNFMRYAVGVARRGWLEEKDIWRPE